MIYLDNAATTQIDERVVEAMMPYLKDKYGNAGSIYRLGRESLAAITKARATVAAFINADPDQIIFTSGGSESNNMVIKNPNIKAMPWFNKPATLCFATEHDSILNSLDNGYVAKPNTDGTANLKTIEDSIRNYGTGLVSVMYVNNETGSVNDVKEIAKLCHKHGALFHTDCVQAASTKKIDVKDLDVDYLSISSHKIHGCKGIGCLYVKDKSTLLSLINGGSAQEYGLRGGTENVAGIVGFAEACMIQMTEEMPDYLSKRELLKSELLKYLGKSEFRINCESANDHGKIVNITFFGIDSETLVLMMDAKDICISAGSACTSHESKPSHVLKAIGLSDEDAHNSVRISFSKYTTCEEIVIAAKEISNCVKLLKNFTHK